MSSDLLIFSSQRFKQLSYNISNQIKKGLVGTIIESFSTFMALQVVAIYRIPSSFI